MRVHFCNDNDKVGDRKGTILRQGRAFFHTSDGSYRDLGHLEWHFFSSHCFLRFELGGRGDENYLGFSAACWLLAVWVSVNPRKLHEWLLKFFKVEDYEDRELSLSIHDNALFWNMWTPSMEWSKVKHGRRQGAFYPIDFLFGRTRYSEVPISEHKVEIPMPEAVYPATVKLVEAHWRRPRWPFLWRRLRRAEVTPVNGIPCPGKGENSWDCGEDKTYSLTCPARTVEEAIGKMVESSMRSRLKYGGPKWRPEAVA